MKLDLKNIGKIRKTEIDFNGITVVAGENNTGKSTVGKALFAILNGVHDIDGQVVQARREKIAFLVRAFSRRNPFPSRRQDVERRLAEEIVGQLSSCLEQPSVLLARLEEAPLRDPGSPAGDGPEGDRRELSERILEVLRIPESSLRDEILRKSIREEFQGQAANLLVSEDASMRLQDGAFEARISFRRDGVQEVSLRNHGGPAGDVVYLDDPLVLDRLHPGGCGEREHPMDHREQLMGKILRERGGTNVVDDLLIRERLEGIVSRISAVCGGTITRDDFLRCSYQEPGVDRPFDFANVSTGLKTFMIIKTILQNGSLGAGGTIILDEPEVHLHPKWQLLFSEIIVLLQKQLDMRIVLNTHSPYFLRAIQVYSSRHGNADRCSYYLAESAGQDAVIKDTTQNLEAVYARLAEPFQKLEDERWQDG